MAFGPQEVNKVLELYKQGIIPSEISNQLNLSRSNVSKIIKKLIQANEIKERIQDTKTNEKLKKITFEINKRNELGVLTKQEDIAKELGISRGNLSKFISTKRVPNIITRDEAVLKYVKNALQENKPILSLTFDNIAKYLNSGLPDIESAARISSEYVSKIVKNEFPELHQAISKEKAFISRNKNIQQVPINEFLKNKDVIKFQKMKQSESIYNSTAELRILKGKLNLGPRDFAISQAQDNYVKQLNENIRQQVNEIGYDEFVRRNPTLIEYAGKRLDSKTGQIVQRTPEQLQKYIDEGFFSIDHKNKKSGEKFNIEFPTNKQIVPKGVNSGFIVSSQKYLKDNLDSYGKDPVISKNIDSIINEGKKYNFTIGTDQIPNYQKSNLAKIFKGVKNIGGLQFPTVTENVLTGFDEQLKPFNFDTSKVTKVLDIPTEEKFVDIKKGVLGRTQRLSNFLKAGKYPLLGAIALGSINATPAKAMTKTEDDKEKLADDLMYDDVRKVFVIKNNPEVKATQSDILYWLADNEILEDVKQVGTLAKDLAITAAAGSAAFALPDLKSTIQESRAAGQSPLRTAGSALAKGFYRLGSPLATAAFTTPQILDEETTTKDIVTDPFNYLGLATMETFGKKAGTIAAPAAAEATGLGSFLKNYTSFKNVGEAVPGRFNTLLRLGLNPRTIAGASRFLGIPGLIASTGYTLYDYLTNKESE